MNHKQIVYSIISSLLASQGHENVEITDESPIHGKGLEFDSLTTATFSAMLENALGKDPYTAHQYPPTVGDVLRFYQ